MNLTKPHAFFMTCKLALAALLSSLLMIAQPAQAHEVNPTIADMTVEGGQVVLDMRLNIEAFVAGVNLDGLADTNDSAASGDYDALRAETPEELETRLRSAWPDIATGMALSADGAAVPLDITTATIPPVGNIDLPRPSQITLTGQLPEGTDSLTFDWGSGYGTLILRQQGVEQPYTGTLSGGDSTGAIPLAGGEQLTGWQAFAQYIPVGFDHILPLGLDHILFVLGLFFLAAQFKPLLWQVTAFTAAHTVTLALGALGLVNIPGEIVEPIIAASIVFVAVENILSKGFSKWRPVVVFAFGLLHGLGFASVLGDFGLPEEQFVPALLGFNVGVEFGQLTVIAVTFLFIFYALMVDHLRGTPKVGQALYAGAFVVLVGVALWSGWSPLDPLALGDIAVFALPAALLAVFCFVSILRVDEPDSYRRYVAVPASVFIALIGTFWFVERVFL